MCCSFMLSCAGPKPAKKQAVVPVPQQVIQGQPPVQNGKKASLPAACVRVFGLFYIY